MIKWYFLSQAIMWCATAVAVAVGVYITGEPKCLLGMAAPMAATLVMSQVTLKEG